MEDNPELERAEAELAERLRREKEGRPHAKWTDYAIFFAAAIHFVHALVWTGLFFFAPVFMLSDSGKHSRLLILWLLSLPTAAVSFGIACALDRVLDLTSPVRRRRPNAPEAEPVEPA